MIPELSQHLATVKFAYIIINEVCHEVETVRGNSVNVKRVI